MIRDRLPVAIAVWLMMAPPALFIYFLARYYLMHYLPEVGAFRLIAHAFLILVVAAPFVALGCCAFADEESL
jgi:hypothetical protein